MSASPSPQSPAADSIAVASAPPPQTTASRTAATNSTDAAQASTRGQGRNRPRASLACINCRQRKIRCNSSGRGQGSPCTSCISLGILCEISRDGDRRKAGSREQVARLQDRVQFLESIVAQGRRESVQEDSTDDPMEPSNESLDDPVALVPPTFAGQNLSPSVSHSSSTRNRESISALPAHHVEDNHAMNCAHDSNDPFSDMFDGPLTSQSSGFNTHGQQGQQPAHAATGPYSAIMTASNGFTNMGTNTQARQSVNARLTDRIRSDLGTMTPPSEKDSGRLDVDAEHGQFRFYGPTSQRYIQQANISTAADEPLSETEHHITQLNLDSAPLREVLFKTFWKAQPLSIVLINETLFNDARQLGGRQEYYSVFLENSLLACATRMSTSADVRVLGAKYAERAKADISQELETPNLATLQAFLLLSDFEATRGRDRLGYTYCGISCRLVFDLGLAESCFDLIARGIMTESEAKARHLLFLGTFVFDKLWTLYLGRPSAIPDAISTAAQQRASSQGWSGSPSLDAWVGLCTDMSEVTEILNNASPLGWEALERLGELDTKIRQRCEALPPSLSLNDDRISDLAVNNYSLHIQFLGLRIVVHRVLSKAAFREARGSNLNDEHGSPNSERLGRSRQVMYECAVRIARLLSVYHQISGIENVVTIMLDNMYLAATVLVSHVLRAQLNDPFAAVERDVQWLRSLSDMLSKAQKHYPVTKRMRSTLSSFVDDTFLAGMFGHWPRKGDSAGTNHGGLGINMQQSSSAGPSQTLGQTQDLNGFGGSLELSNDPVFQDMDLRNMMSWVLSPTDQL